jgi:methylisocitrate lyase
MHTARVLKERLAGGENLVAPGVWDVLSTKVTQHAGFPMAAFQSFQYAAGCGVPDIAVKTASDVLDMTFKIAGEADIPLLVDFEEGFGSPGHAAYWAREFERAGAAAVHIDDKGPVHMCPWLPGSADAIQVSPAEYTADCIRAMAEAREDMLIVARCQVKGADTEQEELRRLKLYVQAGADIAYAPKAATMSNDLDKLRRAAGELGVPVLVQMNPPGYISGYVPAGSSDGKSIADRPFEELFAAGVRIIVSPQLYGVAYKALLDTLRDVQRCGSLQPARDRMLSFDTVLELVGFERFERSAS